MVDVTSLPENACGSVPTPALVAPIEFTMRRADFAALGGHVDSIVPLDAVAGHDRVQAIGWQPGNPWPLAQPRRAAEEER